MKPTLEVSIVSKDSWFSGGHQRYREYLLIGDQKAEIDIDYYGPNHCYAHFKLWTDEKGYQKFVSLSPSQMGAKQEAFHQISTADTRYKLLHTALSMLEGKRS